ncbi:MAG: PilZ domain-containing protein [Candidatus Omnitrophica bacterium]|nr:PilZ domain-containing protein [Candidatus Omnitrophota bacterium]
MRTIKAVIEDMKGKEKRKFTRLQVYHLLKYKIIKKPEEIRTLSFVRNISAGGALFFTQEYIPLESVVDLEMVFPSHEASVTIRAKVVRVNFIKKMEGFEVGVEFLEVDQKVRDFINKKILGIYQKEKEKGGKKMKVLSVIFLLLAAACAGLGLVTRFMNLNILVMPLQYMNIANTTLLFSIALSLLALTRK